MSLTGGWPLVGINSSTPWDLNGEQFLQEKLLDSDAFFSMAVYFDPRKSSRYIIRVSFSLHTVYSGKHSQGEYFSNLLKKTALFYFASFNFRESGFVRVRACMYAFISSMFTRHTPARHSRCIHGGSQE